MTASVPLLGVAMIHRFELVEFKPVFEMGKFTCSRYAVVANAPRIFCSALASI